MVSGADMFEHLTPMLTALALRLLVLFECICELFDKRRQNRFAVYPVARGPARPGHQECSKEHVKHREVYGGVLVDCFFFGSMVLVMKLRCTENIAPFAHIEAQICMDEDRGE